MTEAGFPALHQAIDAVDADAVARLLDADPALANAAGGPNRNRPLAMAAFTGSQRLVALLLERGADPAGANVHGWTALHQAAYANQATLARALLAAGAPADAEARGAGGTPLVVALFWGNRDAADVLLAAAGPLPSNLRVAAATGAVRLPDATTCPRGFYRPHSGFPEWTPSGDRREAVDEALSWAARNDRPEAFDELLGLGAHLEADVYRGTALGWAAATGAGRAVTGLLERGADVDGRTTFGGPDHGEAATPLMLAAQAGRADAVDALLAAGADRTSRDGLHGGTAADWAEVGGHARLADRLRQA